MNNNKELKNKHEESVASTFVRLYNPGFKFIKHGNDQTEPDCVFGCDDEILGVEVVSVYHSDRIAEKEWTLARSIANNETPRHFRSGIMVNFTESFLARIQKEINKKCDKIYSGVDKTILCIDERNPLSEAKDVQYFVSKGKWQVSENW